MDFVEFKSDEIWEDDEDGWVEDENEDLDWGDDTILYQREINKDETDSQLHKLLTEYVTNIPNTIDISFRTHKGTFKIYIGFKISNFFTPNEVKYFNMTKWPGMMLWAYIIESEFYFKFQFHTGLIKGVTVNIVFV
jgi:hypothetical protein